MNPTPSQQQAIDSTRDVILCAAAAGSGKTSTLITRIKRLIENGTDPARIIAITFTNAAAREMKSRLKCKVCDGSGSYEDEAIPGEAVPCKCGGISTALGNCSTLHSFMLRLLNEFGVVVGYSGKITVLDESAADEMLAAMLEETNFRGDPELLKAEIKRGLVATGPAPSKERIVAQAFHRRLIQTNCATFDTILSVGIVMLGKMDLTSLGLRWDYMSVDEFQDSTDEDAAIYRLLPVRNKFYVGDDLQAIYSFRGGAIGHILHMAQKPLVELIRMEENFRSDTLICDMANDFIAHNRNRIDKRIVPFSQKPGEISCERFGEPDEEVANIFQFCQNFDPNETAVLLRTNAMTNFFKEALGALGVVIAGRKAHRKPQDWKRCLLWLSFLSNPENNATAALVLKDRGFKKKAILEAQVKFEKEFTNLNALCLGFPVGIQLSDVPGVLARERISPESLAKVTSAIDQSNPDTIGDLIVALEEGDEPDEKESELFVGTIHRAKGREWDHVFLPALEEGIIPMGGAKADIEEERRVLFVGITRARHFLQLSHCQIRKSPWGKIEWKDQRPSPFLREISTWNKQFPCKPTQ